MKGSNGINLYQLFLFMKEIGKKHEITEFVTIVNKKVHFIS